MLAELSRALRGKFRTPAALAKETDEFLWREAEVIGEAPKPEITLRDKHDVGIVEQAVAGGADVLVTGARDLIEMGEDRPLPIVTPRGFWDLLRSESAESE